jgi:hypothetical protein
MDLEVLHKKVPLLHSLSLDYDGPIPFPSSNYPTDIEPASSIMTLSVGSHISLTTESCLVLLDYLNSKYPNVTTFGHSILYGIGDGSNQCMTRGFIPYIRNISPHLVSLTVPSLAQFYHLTPVLEENNCLLEEFVCVGPINSTEITQITESSQAHTIQKLSIGMNHGWNRAFMNHLSNLTALTELSIFGRNEPPVSVSKRIHISDMLEAVGRSLITLKIAYISICLDNSSTPSYPNLKTLKLVSSHTPKNLDFFISKAFPNLNTLVIDRCDWTTSSFYFCGLKLSHLEVRHCLPSSSSHVLIATLCNNEKRWYTANNVSKWISQPNGLLSDSPAMHSLAFDQYDGFPFATFICDSLYSFFMVNVLI